MRKLKIYLETTVFNYYFDEDRPGHEDVVELFDRIKEGRYEVLTSEYTVREIERAPEPKRSKMIAIVDALTERIDLDRNIEALANRYVDEGIIPSKYRGDAIHVAVASIVNADCIVSYNFQHINKLKTMIETRRINLSLGYKGIEFCTAKEVVGDDEEA